jgi:carbamoyl-phosphate synthase large subunit
VARRLAQAGFALVASAGTAASLEAAGLRVETLLKVHESRTNIEDAIRSGEIQLVINTPIGRQAAYDDRYLRRAAVEGIAVLQQQRQVEVIALQAIHEPWGAAHG